MGGLLALALASTYDLSGLALLAPAVGVRLKGMRFLPLVAFFRPKIPVSWESDPAYTFFDDRDPDDEEYLGGEYWSWGFMRQLSDLAALQRKVESDLPRIHTPVLTVSARNDEVVGDKGIGLLERGVGGKFEKVILPESGHYIPYDPHPGEKEAAMDAVIDFFERIE
jgi:esterase/lipase